MDTLSSIVFVLISACLCWTSCTGRIELCTDDSASFENGTAIPAILGKPVSVVFCVQCEARREINPYILIKHPNYRKPSSYDYYKNNDVEPLMVKFDIDQCKATVNITIKKVKNTDLASNFSVRFNINGNNQDYSVFVFQLRLEEKSELSTVSPQTTDVSSTAVTSTLVTSQCRPAKTSACPEKWYQVDISTCLLVISDLTNSKPKPECNNHKATNIKFREIVTFRSCMAQILEESKGASINYVVRVNNDNYVNVQNGAQTRNPRTYSVVCLNGTSSPVPTDASTWPTTDAMTSAAKLTLKLTTLSSTLMSTVSSQATSVTSTTLTSTQVTPQCLPDKTPACPGNWYQFDTDTCLLVTQPSQYSNPDAECSKNGGDPVRQDAVNKYRACLAKILTASNGAPINYVLRISASVYMNVENGRNTNQQRTFSVGCSQRTGHFKSPTISRFSLYKSGSILLDNSAGNVTVNTTSGYVMFTCQAEGNPTPSVTITLGSLGQITPGTWFQLNCSQTGVATCTARSSSLGSSQAHKQIQISTPTTVKSFTIAQKFGRFEIRPGDDVKLECSVNGCPELVTITRDALPIAEVTSYTSPLIHEIKDVNCSNMGTYICLAKSQSGEDVQKTADLKVWGCPVTLCQGEATSREITHVLGQNVTFSICLMSSEELKNVANESKIIVNLARRHTNSFYWTANITMYNIKATDYRTHTIRIANSDGRLDYHWTLKGVDTPSRPSGQSSQETHSEVNALLIALPPTFFIIIVFIIVGIVLYRVRGTRSSRSRTEKTSGSDNDDSGEVLYANLKNTSVGRTSEVKEEVHEQGADTLQCEEQGDLTDLTDKESGRIISAEGLVYMTVVHANKQFDKKSKRGKQTTKQEYDDGGCVEYITLDFEKTGKVVVADEGEHNEEESEINTETQQ